MVIRSVYKAGGQDLAANTHAFSIAKTSLTFGGPAITLSSKVVSHEAGGTWDTGMSKITLAASAGPSAFQGVGRKLEVSRLMGWVVGVGIGIVVLVG